MAMDTYQIEYFRNDGTRVGMRVSAYSSYEAQRFMEQMPDYSQMAKFPEKVESGY